jgi:hypothetical protein
LTLVQPPQYLGRHAMVLALNEAGKFVVVRLEKSDGSSVSEAWRITEIVEPANRDRGEPHGSSPPTPPDMRVRIRRFGGLSNQRTINLGTPSESK